MYSIFEARRDAWDYDSVVDCGSLLTWDMSSVYYID
jgi:hypothetical protein